MLSMNATRKRAKIAGGQTPMGNEGYGGAAPRHRPMDWIAAEFLATGACVTGLVMGEPALRLVAGVGLGMIAVVEAVLYIRRPRRPAASADHRRPEELIPAEPPEAVYRSPSSGAAIGSILFGCFGLLLE